MLLCSLHHGSGGTTIGRYLPSANCALLHRLVFQRLSMASSFFTLVVPWSHHLSQSMTVLKELNDAWMHLHHALLLRATPIASCFHGHVSVLESRNCLPVLRSNQSCVHQHVEKCRSNLQRGPAQKQHGPAVQLYIAIHIQIDGSSEKHTTRQPQYSATSHLCMNARVPHGKIIGAAGTLLMLVVVLKLSAWCLCH